MSHGTHMYESEIDTCLVELFALGMSLVYDCVAFGAHLEYVTCLGIKSTLSAFLVRDMLQCTSRVCDVPHSLL